MGYPMDQNSPEWRSKYLWASPDLPERLTDEQAQWIITTRAAERTPLGLIPTWRAIAHEFDALWPRVKEGAWLEPTKIYGRDLVRAACLKLFGDMWLYEK